MKVNKSVGLLSLMAILPLLLGCAERKEKVIVYSALEDYRNMMFKEEVENRFPNVEFIIQSLNSAAMASRLIMEGPETEADIVFNVEITNAEMIIAQRPDVFQDLSPYDTSKYLDEVLGYQSRHHLYHIMDRESGCILINKKVLAEHGLEEPSSYDDLLKPEYKGLISMPNPKTSGNGYGFYKNLMTAWGEETGLAYFEKLADNVREFTTSGPGVAKECDRGEIAIGLAETFQSAMYAENNSDLKIKFFPEGSSYIFSIMSVINGRFERQIVRDVYDDIFNRINFIDKARFVPDVIYKSEYQPASELPKFPTDITYGEMGDPYDWQWKQHLLDEWRF